jgi:ketosteroid isomerase-like protein
MGGGGMKRWFVAGLALMLAAPATARPAEAVVNAWLDALTHKDRAALAAMIGDDAVFEYPFDKSGKTEAGSWRMYRGRDAVLKNYVDVALARLSPIGWTEREMTRSADGKRVFVEALGDMGIDGVPYRNRYVLRFDIKGDRIIGMKEYLNPVTSAIATHTTTGAESTPR